MSTILSILSSSIAWMAKPFPSLPETCHRRNQKKVEIVKDQFLNGINKMSVSEFNIWQPVVTSKIQIDKSNVVVVHTIDIHGHTKFYF